MYVCVVNGVCGVWYVRVVCVVNGVWEYVCVCMCGEWCVWVVNGLWECVWCVYVW